MTSFRYSLHVVIAVGFLASSASGQIRIVNYNTNGGPRADMGTVLSAINADEAAGIAKPIGILLLQESSSVATTTQAFADLLNSLPGTEAQNYVVGTLNGGTSGGGRPTVVYDANSVTLIEEIAFGTVNTSNQARQTLRYRFRPVGYDSSADFYVYNDHYKAGDTTTDRNRRQVEAAAIRANSDALGEGAHIIYAGDFNVSSNLEAMWTTLRATGAGQAFDPLNREGIWGNSLSYRDIHTQSPVTAARFSGQTTGGMDDRFDFQLLSGEFLDGEGLSYISGTYRAFGNNGTHPLNGEIDHPSNTAEPLNVLTAIANSSDHLPVIVDYQLPAAMQVVMGAAPSQVIVGADVQVSVTVSNVANVVAVNGADELDYQGDVSGMASGDFAGSDDALGSGQTHQVTLDTLSVGNQSASLQVTSSSQAAANASFSTTVDFAVLDHANASFSTASDENSIEIDFGIVASQSTPAGVAFMIANKLSSLGITADLDLDQILASGDVGAFTTDLALFSGLEAGAGNAYEAILNTTNIGIFEAQYSLGLSDEDLLGAADLAPLALTLSATVALAGDANLDGFVSIADVAALQISYGGSGAWAQGDFNGDGQVTIADVAALQINFGSGSPFPSMAPQFLPLVSDRLALPTAVPEIPGSILIASILMLAPLRYWVRKGAHSATVGR